MSLIDGEDDIQKYEEYKRYVASLPRQFTPFYDAEPNEPIPLYQGEMTLLESDGHKTTSNGMLFASWFPTPSVRFKLEANTVDPSSWFLVMSPTGSLSVPAINLAVDVQMTRMSPGIAEGFIDQEITLGVDTEVSYLQLHIVNFVDYHGEPIAVNDRDVTTAQITMENDDWQLTIHVVAQGRKRIEELKKEYGYAITHVAKLRSKRGETFSTNEAVRVIDKLNRLFSFIKGAEAVSFLTVGFDVANNKVWEHWAHHHF